MTGIYSAIRKEGYSLGEKESAFSFHFGAVGLAAKSADGESGGDHAMAGDVGGKGIPLQRLAHRAGRSTADRMGEVFIGCDEPSGNFKAGVVDLFLKRSNGGFVRWKRCGRHNEPYLEPAKTALKFRSVNELVDVASSRWSRPFILCTMMGCGDIQRNERIVVDEGVGEMGRFL